MPRRKSLDNFFAPSAEAAQNVKENHKRGKVLRPKATTRTDEKSLISTHYSLKSRNISVVSNEASFSVAALSRDTKIRKKRSRNLQEKSSVKKVTIGNESRIIEGDIPNILEPEDEAIEADQYFAPGNLTQSFYFSAPPKDIKGKNDTVDDNIVSKPQIHDDEVEEHPKSPSPGLMKITKLLRDSKTKYNMGVLFSANLRYDKSLDYLHSSLAIRKLVLGIEHVLVMEVQQKLGEVYQNISKFDHARYHYYVAYKNVLRREGEDSNSVDAERLRYILTEELGVTLERKQYKSDNDSGEDTYDESDVGSCNSQNQVILLDLDNGVVL